MRILEIKYRSTEYDVRYDYSIYKNDQGEYPVKVEEVRNCSTQCAITPQSPTYNAIVKEALPQIQAELTEDENEIEDDDFLDHND